MKPGWALLMLCGFLPVGPVWGQVAASQLPGSWQLRLWVTGPAAESAGPREARGQIELRRMGTGPVPRGLQWVYSVTYDTTLHVMLGPPQSGPARAVLRARDSVELAFNPFIDHGAFRLTGVVRGDSISGSWHRTSFADDGYRGSFTMVRRGAGQRRDATVPGNAATAGQDVVWQELLRPVDRPRAVLVLESMCNSPTSPLAEARYRERQTVLMLPQYDGWLSRRMSSACLATPAEAVGMDYEVISIVTDWLKRTVTFPQ